MKIVIAPDSYKGSLSSIEVANFMEQGVRKVVPEADVVKIPIADGGEGTVEAMIRAVGGTYREVEVIGPLGHPLTAKYGILTDQTTAVIEMAAASGLTLVPEEARNPLLTTTFGTGQLIRDALKQGCRKIIVGIGGSATNDGGVGMAQALGVRFLDASWQNIGLGGGSLGHLHSIDMSDLEPLIASCELIAASDVTNPLGGPNGASVVFGPQKGATPEMVELLDSNLLHFSRIIQSQLGIDISSVPGGGAAGGLGAGLMAFTNARIARGIDLILEAANFEETVRNADLVLTGEGRTDSQTAYGKTPVGVATLAKKHNKPVICISGSVTTDVDTFHELGLDVVIGAVQAPMSLEAAIQQAPQLIRQATSAILRAVLIPYKYKRPDEGGNHL
jgi:glycerate 2-kinase